MNASWLLLLKIGIAAVTIEQFIHLSSIHFVSKKTRPPLATLRARHLVWYGKADLRVVKLDDSFGKFNFLDTDAAARLTVEQSQERINADLTQLLLGAEAAKTLDRFERLTKALLDTKRDLERDIEIRDQRRLDATARLQELRNSPQESDQLFLQLTTTLNAVGWTTLPSHKHDAENVANGVQSALVNIGVLKAAGPSVPMDRKELTAASAQLARATIAVQKILERRRQLDQTQVQAKQNVDRVNARADAVARLLPMLDAGLTEMGNDLNVKTAQVEVLGAALGRAEPAARTVAELGALMGASFRGVVDDYENQVEQRAKDLNDARRSLDALERTQAVLTTLTQQLRSVARQIIDHTHDETHCPLCATQFERAELLSRMQEDLQSARGDHVQQARRQVQDTEARHKQAVRVLQALRTLSEYQPVPSGRTTVPARLTQIAVDQAELRKLQAELDALRRQFQEHEKAGRTLERLTAIAREAGIQPSNVNRQSVEALNNALTKERGQYLELMAKNQEDRRKSDEELNAIARDIGLSALEASLLLTGISERASIVDQAARAIDALAEKLKLDSVPSDLELEALLREAHEAAIRVNTAVVRERNVSEAMTKESRLVQEATAEVSAFRVQVGRINSALNVISDLIEKQSGQILTNQVLRENGAQIAATFARIHAPSEFDVEVNENGLKITRRSTKSNVDLNEMSSGQRAAFTLSLFLAMNGRLRTGPTVIIFDDPVAHVDDINTLSFMDHLRDVAIEGARQIFFATADSKLAGLFARKFRFMGDKFRQIELQRE